jgi:hypothetical protein
VKHLKNLLKMDFATIVCRPREKYAGLEEKRQKFGIVEKWVGKPLRVVYSRGRKV